MRSALLLLAGLLSSGSSLCRLSIPDSGGASQLPASFADIGVTRVQVAPDTVVPGEGPDAPPIRDFCGGSEGCSRACCTTDNCFAWAWQTGGSVHAACGSNTCTIFIAPTPNGWDALKTGATLYGGYNYGGYIFEDVAVKIACCVGGTPPSARLPR